MKIKAKTKNLYGNDLIYIINPAERLNIELLLGKKTINKIDIALFKTLGVDIILI